MSKNPWVSNSHRFAVEELLDYPVVGNRNRHAPVPAKAGRSVPSGLEREEPERKAKAVVAYAVPKK